MVSGFLISVVGQFLVHVFPSKYGLEGERGHGF
jgi:hypothetical protein